MQTSREIIDGLLRGTPVERVGLFDAPWDFTVKKWVAEGYPAGEDGEPIDYAEHFNFDMCQSLGGFTWDAMVVKPELIEATGDWRIIRNGSGATIRRWKNKAGTPEHIAFDMTSRKVWEEKYKPHVIGSAPQRVTLAVTEETKKEIERHRNQGRSVKFGNMFVWEGMRQSMGDVCLYENVLLDPEWIHDYCRTYTDVVKECHEILFAEAGKPDNVWLYEDLGYRGSLFCSPATFDELIFPYFREMCDFFHGYDIPVVLHTCGLTEPIIDTVIDLGFDGLNPLEVKAGNDPLRIAEKYGDRIAFIGGFDERVLESGDRDLIRAEVEKLVNGMKARGARYVFGSDHSVSTNVKMSDFEFALAVYRENMMY